MKWTLRFKYDWRLLGALGLIVLGFRTDASLTNDLEPSVQNEAIAGRSSSDTEIIESPGNNASAAFNAPSGNETRFSDSFSVDLDQSQDLANSIGFRGGPPTAIRGGNDETFANMNRLIGSDNYELEGLTPGNSVVTFGKDHPGLTKSNAIKNGTRGSGGIDEITFGMAVAAAPEPAEWAMLLFGAVILGLSLRHRATAN